MVNWTEHNLIRNGDVLSVAAWQEFDWLRQGFSLRSAGNVSHAFGDASVAQKNIAEALDFSKEQWTGMQQVHGNHIEVVELWSDFADTDGMITAKTGKLLVAVVADCVPLLFVDPIRRVVAVAHAGRRGTEKEIAKMTVKEFFNAGSRVEDLRVAIGPSIGPCCYETDLWSDNERQLREIGVKSIIRTDLCTKHHNDLFFSHRGDKVEGRFAGLIGLVGFGNLDGL